MSAPGNGGPFGVPASAEAFSPWRKILDSTGASFTGWTQDSGTWNSNGTEFTVADSGGGTRVRAKWNTKVLTALLVFEAEVMILSGTGSDRAAGLTIGYAGANDTNAYAGKLHSSAGTAGDSVQLEADAASAIATTNFVWGNYNEWHKVRMVTGLGASLYVDGTLINSGEAAVRKDRTYLGLVAHGASAKFRNLKAWEMSLPA